MGDPLKISIPGPRLVGFRYGRITQPGMVGSLLPEYNPGVDILSEVQEAKCGAKRGHDAPSRGCMCGIHAYSSPGHLIQSNRTEWDTPDNLPMVALYWGRIIPAEKGFRAQYQLIIGIGTPFFPVYASHIQYKDAWSRWQAAFRERQLPIQTVTGGTRYDEAFALQKLGERYGTLLGDIPKAYRVAPSPKWEPAPSTFSSPSVSPIPPASTSLGASQMVQPNPALPPIRIRRSTTRLPSTGTCQCGCGLPTKAMFKPGHDAKLKGQLKRRAKRGDQAAADELQRRGW